MKIFRKPKINVDLEIALTHVLAKKKQTVIVSFAVAIGIAAFIFLNSLVVGFNRDSDEALFKSTPHIRIYVDEKLSQPLNQELSDKTTTVIVNPKIINENKKLLNPKQIVENIKTMPDVTTATTWLNVNVFYNNGSAEVTGTGSGININEANEMFDIKSTMVEGDINNLLSTPNGIIIGVGIAENLSVKTGDNISVVSPQGIVTVMKVVGLFKTSNSIVDKSKSYLNLSVAQQLMAQGPDYITEIYVNVKDPNKAVKYISTLKALGGYNAEDWKTASASAEASKKIRGLMMGSISLIVLIVAAFTIYNIVNMTVKQKMHDIAILKAQGFAGKSVVKIFIGEALVIGMLGTFIGMFLGSVLVKILSKVYIGGDREYFPIQFEPKIMLAGLFIGFLVTLIAGYIPARGAAKVDPVSIFRNL
jgi:lipoprotein-releasing system permease protein